jgi:hypothetical protein
MKDLCQRCRKEKEVTILTKHYYEKGSPNNTERVCKDCLTYEKKRDKLIPKAEAYADGLNSKPLKGENKESYDDAWNLAFFSKMAELARSL